MYVVNYYAVYLCFKPRNNLEIKQNIFIYLIEKQVTHTVDSTSSRQIYLPEGGLKVLKIDNYSRRKYQCSQKTITSE